MSSTYLDDIPSMLGGCADLPFPTSTWDPDASKCSYPPEALSVSDDLGSGRHLLAGAIEEQGKAQVYEFHACR